MAPREDRASRVRYRVLLLTFLVSFLMYMDRVCMGAVAPAIMRDFHLSKIAMGWSASAYNWGYTLFQVPGGWMVDRFGPRLILGFSLAWWSLFTGVTGLARGANSLAVARALFGAGEAAAFPASSRALYRWLPMRDRAFGQGFQHAGARLGGAVAPAIVAALLSTVRWPTVFYLFGGFGIVWAVGWYGFYRDDPGDHPSVNAQELRIIHDCQPVTPRKERCAVPWRQILHSCPLWYLSVLYFCYGWVFWLYLVWLPTYLVEVRHLVQLKMGLAASLPLLAATGTNMLGDGFPTG